MTKKSQNITSKLAPFVFVAIVLAIWSAVSYFEIVPAFMLPSPFAIVKVFVNSYSLLFKHSLTTLSEAAIGLTISILIGFALAIIMDYFRFLYKAIYPLLILSQTIPVIAIAPLLVLWFGYGILPKILLVFLACFFPIIIGLLQGFMLVDKDMINLLKSMGASKTNILIHVKIPSALPSFFAGLKIAAAYSIVGAVVSEWLGGAGGLGVYMTRVRKSYAFDKMFAVIFLVSLLSLALMKLVAYIEKKSLPWYFSKEKK